MKIPRYLVLTLLLGALAGPLWGQPSFLAELPEVQLFTVEDAEALVGVDLSEEQAVREIYSRVTHLVQASGYDLVVEVSGVRTYYRKDFGAVLSSELASLPDGEALDLDVTFLETPRLGRPRAHVKPEWVEVQAVPLESPEWTYTFAEAMGLSESAGESGGVVAATTFAVRLGFGGKEKRYRAMVQWKHVDGEEASFTVHDWGLQNLSMALTIEDPATPHPSVFKLESSENLIEEPDYKELTIDEGKSNVDGGCTANIWTYNQPVIVDSDQMEHSSGRHAANLELYGHCRCYSSCFASCSPELNKKACSETGTLEGGICHKPFKSTRQLGDSGQTRAHCRGGLGCAITSCETCGTCAPVSFSFTVISAGFSISTQGFLLTDMSMSDRAACICQGAGDEPPPPPDCDRGEGF